MSELNIALAIHQLESELERELKYYNIGYEKHDRLYFLNKNYTPIFAQVTWKNCQKLSITSINDGIKKLKALGKNWSLFTIGNHRRAQLIQEGLYKFNNKAVPFLGEKPKFPMGGWTLIDQNTIVYATETTSLYPLGEIHFAENKTMPPSRAYLKLWEFFTLHHPGPKPGSEVIDMGATPGGWSWVLSQMQLNVTSVDKAALDEKIQKIPNIKFVQESAFGLNPKQMTHIQWFFSDIICYPERLLELIKNWMDEAHIQNFVCTIKFQGEADFKFIDEFLKIPNSHIVHLYHNKHEVTWWVTADAL